MATNTGDRYEHLREMAAAAKQATCDRLETACRAIKAGDEKVTADAIKRECGLDYKVYSESRNAAAYTIYRRYADVFRTVAVDDAVKPMRKRRRRRGQRTTPRDPLLDQSTTELVALVHKLQQDRAALVATRDQALQQRDEARAHNRNLLASYVMQVERTCALGQQLQQLDQLRREYGLELRRKEGTS